MTTRKQIRVSGIVQGVGFRPFVYNLAQRLSLAGYVLNSSAGVVIEIEGSEPALQKFLQQLRSSPPPLAQIEQVDVTDLPAEGASGFTIRESVAQAGQFVLVSPDVATCDDCWRDCTDPGNRRYRYAFTNCTNCGPRYTIIQDIPYDRPATTMSAFQMCALCEAEYHDPSDRRFHAQPNACPACGPGVALAQSGSAMPHTYEPSGAGESVVFTTARRLLREGKILAVKGLGGFFLACDAQNDAVVLSLRERKRRSDKPFALMARDLAAVEAICQITDQDRAALQSPQRPIVILPRREDARISQEISPGNKTLGVMLPYTPLHAMLFGDQPSACPVLVMTSGNISEEPIVTANAEAWERLRNVADWFLFHNRDVYMRVDDSVVRSVAGQARVLRRSRGYVPHAIDLGLGLEEVLATGAELKNTLCLTKAHYAILSQHIGDLENYETLVFFEETLRNLKKLFRVEPRAIAHDLHPQYMSSRWALQAPTEKKIGVQHHHAHIAACMAENHLRGRVIGVAFDGTGYGTDGQIWGGEFLVADFAEFERHGHLRYVSLPGGDAAIRQPWRMALSYLHSTFGANGIPDLPFLRAVPATQRTVVDAMLERKINTVETSSCGRLFDAVAVLAGLRAHVTFEGQAAIELEAAARRGVDEQYEFSFEEQATGFQVDMRPAVEQIVREVALNKPEAYISSRFHNTVAAVIVEACSRIRSEQGLERVCLSGGTFQNVYLAERAAAGLQRTGFAVYLHRDVPPNDGGISLGQAVIASALLQRGA